MWKYSEILMDHFMNPRNVGELENPDGHSEVGSPQCGDAMTLDIEVDEKDRITDIRFRTFGCAAAIASASAMTELIKGKTINDALNIKNKQIADFLGGMPPEKFHCSVMGKEALTSAVANFISKREAIENAVRKYLETSKEKFPELSGNINIYLKQAHSKWILLASSKELPEDLARELEEKLRGVVGKNVEIRIES